MIGSTVAIRALFTRLPLLLWEVGTGLSGLLDSEGTRERAPFSAESTMSDVKDGVAVFTKASIFWASRLQASTCEEKKNPWLLDLQQNNPFLYSEKEKCPFVNFAGQKFVFPKAWFSLAAQAADAVTCWFVINKRYWWSTSYYVACTYVASENQAFTQSRGSTVYFKCA